MIMGFALGVSVYLLPFVCLGFWGIKIQAIKVLSIWEIWETQFISIARMLKKWPTLWASLQCLIYILFAAGWPKIFMEQLYDGSSYWQQGLLISEMIHLLVLLKYNYCYNATNDIHWIRTTILDTALLLLLNKWWGALVVLQLDQYLLPILQGSILFSFSLYGSHFVVLLLFQ